MNQSSLGRKGNLVGWPAHHRVGMKRLLSLNIERDNGDNELYHVHTRDTLLPAPTGTMVARNHTLEQSERGSEVVEGGTGPRARARYKANVPPPLYNPRHYITCTSSGGVASTANNAKGIGIKSSWYLLERRRDVFTNPCEEISFCFRLDWIDGTIERNNWVTKAYQEGQHRRTR